MVFLKLWSSALNCLPSSHVTYSSCIPTWHDTKLKVLSQLQYLTITGLASASLVAFSPSNALWASPASSSARLNMSSMYDLRLVLCPVSFERIHHHISERKPATFIYSSCLIVIFTPSWYKKTLPRFTQ